MYEIVGVLVFGFRNWVCGGVTPAWLVLSAVNLDVDSESDDQQLMSLDLKKNIYIYSDVYNF